MNATCEGLFLLSVCCVAGPGARRFRSQRLEHGYKMKSRIGKAGDGYSAFLLTSRHSEAVIDSRRASQEPLRSKQKSGELLTRINSKTLGTTPLR